MLVVGELELLSSVGRTPQELPVLELGKPNNQRIYDAISVVYGMQTFVDKRIRS